MKELDCVLDTCLKIFMGSPGNGLLLAAFGVLAAVSIYSIARNGIRSKIRWSYAFAFSILFPLTYYAFSMGCHEALPVCAEKATIYSIPAALLGSLLFVYLMPFAYLAWNRTVRSERLSAMLPSAVPVHIADRGKPFAFSYGGLSSWIVISQGMIDLLSDEELEAVLLHEYAHIANDSSFYKASNWLYSKIPVLHPFLGGGALEDEEERKADAFAVRAQGTARHLESAKSKVEEYFSY